MKQMSKASRFLRIVCPRCRMQHTVFGKSATRVKCKKCSYLLASPQGGKSKVRAAVKEVYLCH